MKFVSDSYQAAQDGGLPNSFTPFHERLLDLCLKPRKMEGIPPLEYGETGFILTPNDLDSMQKMVECDFVAAFRKTMALLKKKFDRSSSTSLPHVFDVYLMNQENEVAVCVPFQNELHWWNGLPQQEGGKLWPLATEMSSIRKVTGLSGPARILQALDQSKISPTSLSEYAMQRQELFSPPPTVNFWRKLYVNPYASQKLAVDGLIDFKSGFYCIQSPPGCGKTTTMIKMILQAAQQGKVIVTAPSNEAVAKLALNLYETGKFFYPDVVVVGSNCHESVHFLEPSMRSRQYKMFLRNYDKVLFSRGGIPTKKQQLAAQRMVEEFGKWLHLEREDWTIDILAHVCQKIDDKGGLITSQGLQVRKTLLGDSSIVFCTLNSAGSLSLRAALQSEGFKTLMLHEGGQCHEAEFFIATTFPGIQRIVLMGDPKSQFPIVKHPASYHAGYGQSFLGQVLNVAPNRVHLLDTQDRMDPAILKFPNERFYQNRLSNGEGVEHRYPRIEHPFLFVNTNGNGAEKKSKKSWQNRYEALAINRLLGTDTDIQKFLHDTEDCKIIITSPYASQVMLLKQVIQLPAGTKANLIIATMTVLQDQEADIVIVSTVRTKEIGFADEAVPLNASFMRAKRILRVVGDKGFLESLGDQSTLRPLVAHAEASGSLIDAPTKVKNSVLAACWSLPLFGSCSFIPSFPWGLSGDKMKVLKNDFEHLAIKSNGITGDGIGGHTMLGSLLSVSCKPLQSNSLDFAQMYPFSTHNCSAMFQMESTTCTKFGTNQVSSLSRRKPEIMTTWPRRTSRGNSFGSWRTIFGVPPLWSKPIHPSIVLASVLGLTVNAAIAQMIVHNR